MPARLVQVTLINRSRFPVAWVDDGRPHGFWQAPWYPSNLKHLKQGEQGTWRLESGGVMTGVEGWAYFKIDVPFAANLGARTHYLNLWWERPYIGRFARDATLHAPDGQSPQVIIKDLGFTALGQSDSLLEVAPLGAFVPVTVPVMFANDASGLHLWWIVEILDSPAAGSTLPLMAAPPNRYAGSVLMNAAPADVFGLLTRTGTLSDFWQQQAVESEWRPGTTIRFLDPRTSHLLARGLILEFTPPRRVSYALVPLAPAAEPREQHADCSPATDPIARITIELEPHEQGTMLSVIHDEPDLRAAREIHEHWRHCLAGLQSRFPRF